jgi:peptidoglycan-associated lipoprotein
MRIALLTVPIALAYVAAACHHAQPAPVALAPQVDSSAIERAHEDSIGAARARDAAERRAAQRRLDSLAVLERRSEDRKAQLAALIHFDFDKSTIRPGDARELDEKVTILLANPDVHVQVAGNCDERGSDEYNLALGNRRAISAKQYLLAHGIATNRIEAVSYGRERPLDPAHNEEAWAKNRNDQFTLLGANVVLR